MVLHNLFFVLLTATIYFSLIPFIEQRINAARTREAAILIRAFMESRVPAEYPLVDGAAQQLQLPAEGQGFLNDYPLAAYRHHVEGREFLFRRLNEPGRYQRVEFPSDAYDSFTHRVRLTLFFVLGAIYLLSVLALEFLIMPRYVYSRIRMMLDADRAVREGRRSDEIIDSDRILDDEIGQIMHSRNVTVQALRQHEDELAKALETLEAQDRLASLGLLSASVAHELNTPLSVLLGSLEKMAEQPHDAATRQRLDRMMRVTQRIKKISESLIDFARVRRDVFEPVRLQPLIEEAWDLVGIDEKAVSVNFTNSVGIIDTAMGNGDRLVQVFVNLLRNALNAIKPGGHIEVTSFITLEGGRRWLHLKVEDDGPGIPPDVLPDIFDAFVSTRLDSRGTGLGLTIADGIISQHGGTISAANRASGGACLEVKLPAA
jgi:signal transduction histidine kinase